MTYDGIIFDFNGVLWWDAPLVEEGWQRTAQQLRGRPFSPEEIARQVYGRNNRNTIEYLAGTPLEESEIRRLIDEKESAYRALCLQQGEAFRLSPGAEGLLDFLRAKNIPRTIATASGKVNVDFFVLHLRLDRWFDTGKIVFDDGIRPSKPAPDFYLQAAANLDLAPSRCVVVEDSLSGIRSARAAGIGCVIGLASSQTGEALLRGGADETVENLGQLEKERLFLRD
jgi:HAD superfamily hydrolase (TIGR01509 family)